MSNYFQLVFYFNMLKLTTKLQNVMPIVSNVRLMGPDFAMAMHGVNQDMVTNRPAKHVQVMIFPCKL